MSEMLPPLPTSAEAFVAPCCRRTLQTGLNETHFHLSVIKGLVKSFHAESRGGCSSRLSLCGLKRSPTFFFHLCFSVISSQALQK